MATQRRIPVRVKMISLLSVLLCGLFLSHAYAESRATSRFEASSAAGATAVLEFAATPLVAMTVIPFRLEVKNVYGSPLKGAAVDCNLTMPSMPMPDNHPKIAARNGAYVGEIIFTCTQGAWRLTCAVDPPGEKRQTLVFDIPRVRLR